MKFTNGATRTVLLTKRYAFKVPVCICFNDAGQLRSNDRWPTWWMFRNGFASNRRERRISRLSHPKLCPVLFADPFGFLAVMPRCEPAKGIDSWREHLSDRALCPVEYLYLRRQGLPVDNYRFNFGWLDGQLVSFDYGT